MKKLNRIISAILILASLISVFAVFAFADDTQTTPPDISTEIPGENEGEEQEKPEVDLSAIELLYNRNFSEGWSYDNAFEKMSAHNAYIDYEETIYRKYNYFWRMEATTSTSAGNSTLKLIDAVRESGTVVQLKIKADDACNLGRIFYLTTAGGQVIDLLYIMGNTLYAFRTSGDAYKLGELTDEWLSVSFVFDWDATRTLEDGSMGTLFKSRVYYGDEGQYLDYEVAYQTASDKGWRSMSFGIGADTATDRNGMSYCIDDLRIYNKSKESLDLSEVTDYGSMVNHLADVVVDVQDGPGKKSLEEIINTSLCMKVRVNTALINNSNTYIADKYCAPEIVDGSVMVPLSLLIDFMNYDEPYVHGESYDITTGTSATYITIGRDTANVGGQRVSLSAAPGYLTNAKGEQVAVVAVADISTLFPGWLVTYDDMGLIIVYEGDSSESDEPLLTREKDLDTMLEIMKSFVFDIVTTDKNGKEFDSVEESYRATGEAILSDVYAFSGSGDEENKVLTHPYIFTNQDTFDALSEKYLSADGSDIKEKLSALVAEADKIFSEYAKEKTDGSYDGLKKAPLNVYADGLFPTELDNTVIADTTDGYSPLGTLESIKEYSQMLVTLAFVYQITGDAKYADLAYDLSLSLGNWTHWGPADMVSCATATGNFAVAYDWLYNYYKSKTDGDARIQTLVSILYNKGVKQGYNASFEKPCEFPKTAGGGDVYNTLNTYVNAVSASNMIIGSLLLAEYDEYKEMCADLIGNNLQNLIANGLDHYAPDGSCAESAIIWAESTNGFVKLIMALESAAGTTYGFEDTWGIDKTFYFAYYIEDSDGFIWNYHEGGGDGVTADRPLLSVDTQMFNYAGKFLKDSTLIAIRKNQIAKGKAVTVFDMLFYPDGDVEADSELELDYYMQGIHAFVSRSDWEEGALYTGIMGGANDVYGGQLDSGNFIYRNKGIDWIIDLGSDNNKIYSYYGAYRYHHYRNNADGQNVIIVNTAQTALPLGQRENGNGVITETFKNEHGSYAILQNKTAYGSTVSYANRGLLVTNDRKTVVIQDEVSFPKFQEVYWIAHTASNIEIVSDTVAYLTDVDEDGNQYTLRATIVSRSELKFTKDTSDSAKLSATYKEADYKKNGGEMPYSRKGIQRLIISAKNVLNFNVAVAFEIVDSRNSTEPVGYSWTNMVNWEPTNEIVGDVTSDPKREAPVKENITQEVLYLDIFANEDTAFSKNLNSFYLSLTNVAYILKAFPKNTLDTALLLQSHASYTEHLGAYQKYIAKINGAVAATNNLTKSISGMPS